MHKLLIELWRDGEKIREMTFTDEMIRCSDTITVVTFPPRELAGGLVLATGDKLHLREICDGGES